MKIRNKVPPYSAIIYFHSDGAVGWSISTCLYAIKSPNDVTTRDHLHYVLCCFSSNILMAKLLH
jgi:hypothetical protein